MDDFIYVLVNKCSCQKCITNRWIGNVSDISRAPVFDTGQTYREAQTSVGMSRGIDQDGYNNDLRFVRKWK